MKMTKLFKINAIFAFGLALISCANDIGEVKTKAKAAPKAYLQIETEIPLVRSAGPEEEYALENLKDIYLYVKKIEDEDGNAISVSEKTLASSVTFSAFSTKKYILSDGAGKYTIRMKGTIDSVYFYKKLENVSIRESETNKITLSLEPVKDSSHLDEAYEDFGGINCKMQFDTTNVSSILIKLKRLTFDSESDEFIEETVEEKYITSLNNGNVTYKRIASYTSGSESRIPAGTYRLTLDFLSYDSTLKDDILLNSYPYIVYVERGRNTYIDETFQLDPIYTITYNGISGASLADGSVKQTKYTRKDEVTLPVMKKQATPLWAGIQQKTSLNQTALRLLVRLLQLQQVRQKIKHTTPALFRRHFMFLLVVVTQTMDLLHLLLWQVLMQLFPRWKL